MPPWLTEDGRRDRLPIHFIIFTYDNPSPRPRQDGIRKQYVNSSPLFPPFYGNTCGHTGNAVYCRYHSNRGGHAMKRIDKENYYLDIAETVIERATCLRRC